MYVALCEPDAAVPVIVIGYVPAGVLDEVAIVRLLLFAGGHRTRAEARGGARGQARSRQRHGLRAAGGQRVDTVAVALEPAVTEPEVGAAAIEKSFVTPVPVPASTSIFERVPA